jgi:NADH dehydrogenase
LRNHVLRRFEEAVWTEDAEAQRALTTIVVVGGGPTGLETAGAVYELYNHVLDQEYRGQSLDTRVVLVEMLPQLLTPYPEELQEAALAQLGSLGVEVVLGEAVVEVTADQVQLENGRSIPTRTLIWAAGVQAPPLSRELGIELQKGGRAPVAETMQLKGREQIYVVGDMAYLENEEGQPYPQVIPVAQQQGRTAADNILAHLEGGEMRPFRYSDRGMMATIGRRRAVAWIYNRIPLKGFLAWLAWLGLHLLTLLGFRNRLNVLINWIWNYLTYDRSVRIILSGKEE